MKTFLKILAGTLFLLYPFAVYFGIRYFDARILSLFMLVIMFSYFLPSSKNTIFKKWHKYSIIAIIIALVALLQIFNNIFFIQLYPALMNLIFLWAFTYTLFNPPSMIEKFARLQRPNLEPFAVIYTRKVTIIWCVFLLLNSIISLYTVFFATLETWTLYNGFISYILMGLLFVGEYIVRLFVIRKHEAK